jgi:hypothetical protein
MKKLMLNVAAILFAGTMATYAQTPSSSTPSTPSPSVQQQQPRSGDWSKVETSQIPAPVQQTLRSEKYTGWENDGLYFNKSTNQYSVDIRTGDTPGLYYFDQNGRTVTGTRTTPQSGAASSRPSPTSSPNSSGSTTPAPTPGQTPSPNQ